MEKNYKIFAGIVTYNPDIEKLKKNINSIKNQVQKIVIVDNFSDNIIEIEKIINTEFIIIIKLDRNYGIAYALNRLFEYCIKDGVEYILTLDQDSCCPRNMINIFKKNINENVGIICPTIYDINRDNIIKRNNKIYYEKRCITSGSLTSVSAFNKIGGFDEKMFIDGVDFDFCDRLINNNYKIIRCGNIIMKHEIGNITIRKFLFFKVVVRNHSAFRKYYIAKNIIYLDRKNKIKFFPIKALLRITKLLIIVILYEDDKKNKIKKIVLGVHDGFKLKI